MEHRDQRQGFKSYKTCFCLCFMSLMMVFEFQRVEAYKNYTVGDSLGWFDELNKPGVDYDKWVSGKSFSLGDFLIFNTDSNHTVIQTYKLPTYNSCDAQGDDDVQWSSIQPNSTEVRPITVTVPLLKEGVTYFFSGDYDGEQCMHGQKFAINVTHGKGLPSSIKNNPDYAIGPMPANPAPGPSNTDSGDDQAAPDTVINNDFNHPKKVPQESSSDEESGDDTKKSNGASFLPIRESLLISLIGGVLVFFGIY